ncbi:hypothetical protein STVA_48190 [Allostella vacuolata]|nr:hypothetical protein STVA_48190 [Stella vacuolata]
MSGPAVLVAVTVAGPPDRAFALFTEEVDRWWRRGPVYRFRPGGGRIRFDPGPGGRLVEEYDDGSHFEELRPGRGDRGRDPLHGHGRRHTRRRPAYRMGSAAPRHPARHGLADMALFRMMGDWWRMQLAALAG